MRLGRVGTRWTAEVGLACLLLTGCGESNLTLVVPELPQDTRYVGLLIEREGRSVFASGLAAADADTIVVETAEGIEETSRVRLFAYTAERLSRIELPTDEVLADEGIAPGAIEGPRLPRASFIAEGVVADGPVDLVRREEDIPITAPWLADCTLRACVLAPTAVPETIKVPHEEAGVRIAVATGPDRALLVSDFGYAASFEPPNMVVPLTTVSTGAQEEAVYFEDGTVALLTGPGALMLGDFDSGFDVVGQTEGGQGVLAASPTAPDEIFVMTRAGTLERFTPGGFEVVHRMSVAKPAPVGIGWVGPGHVVAAHPAPGMVLDFQDGQSATLPLDAARNVLVLGTEVLVLTEYGDAFDGVPAIFRLHDGGLDLIHSLEGELLTSARDAWPLREGRSLVFGGNRGELVYFHLDAGACVIETLPVSNVNAAADLVSGLVLGIGPHEVESRAAMFIPREASPPACAL